MTPRRRIPCSSPPSSSPPRAASGPTTSTPACSRDRIVFLGTAIDDQVANLLVAQLLFLESEDPDKPINLYINSPGGDMIGLFAIHDTMPFLNPPVATTCVGQASSAAAVLLAAGRPGHAHRACPTPASSSTNPTVAPQGQSVDLEIQVRETVEMRERMVDILAAATGQTRERIVADIDRDYILRGQAAVDYGLVDEIVTAREVRARSPPSVLLPRPRTRPHWLSGSGGARRR